MVDKCWINIAQCKLNHYLCVQHIFLCLLKYCNAICIEISCFEQAITSEAHAAYIQKICIKQTDFKDLHDLLHFILFHTLIKKAFSFR